MTPERFQDKWGISLKLDACFHGDLDGTIVPWEADDLDAVDSALEALPRPILEAAKVNSLVLAEDLLHGDVLADGKYSVYDPRWAQPGDPLLSASRTSWVVLGTHVVRGRDLDPDLDRPKLTTRSHEEFVHGWDTELECTGSRFCSEPLMGREWVDRGLATLGPIAPAVLGSPHPIPGRKEYDHNAEDWAWAVLWFLLERAQLAALAFEHHDFVRDLFLEEGIPF